MSGKNPILIAFVLIFNVAKFLFLGLIWGFIVMGVLVQEQIRLMGPFRRLRGRTLPGDRYSGCKSGPMGKSQAALSAFGCIFSPAA